MIQFRSRSLSHQRNCIAIQGTEEESCPCQTYRYVRMNTDSKISTIFEHYFIQIIRHLSNTLQEKKILLPFVSLSPSNRRVDFELGKISWPPSIIKGQYLTYLECGTPSFKVYRWRLLVFKMRIIFRRSISQKTLFARSLAEV